MENFLRQLLDMITNIPAPGREPPSPTSRGARSPVRDITEEEGAQAGYPTVQGPRAPYSEMYNPQQFAQAQQMRQAPPGTPGSDVQGPPAPTPSMELPPGGQTVGQMTIPGLTVPAGTPHMTLPPGGQTMGHMTVPGLHISLSPEVLAHLAGKHKEPDEDDK